MRFFGIPSAEANASVYTTAIMAANLTLQPYAIAAKVLMGSVIGLAVYAAYRLQNFRRVIAWGMALALFPLLQFVAYQSAVGIASARLRSGNFDRVTFVFRADSSRVETALNNAAGLCLIHESADRYYIMACPADPAAPRRTVEIRASDVQMMTISSFQQ